MMRVAVLPTAVGRWQGSQVQGALALAGVSCRIEVCEGALEHALLRGDADVAACWLSEWPPAQSDTSPVVISALLQRIHPFDVLVWHPGTDDPRRDFFLREGATVVGGTTLQKVQCQAFRSDLSWMEAPIDVQLQWELWRSKAADAFIASAASLHALGIDFSAVPHCVLHPSECTPAPGQGVVACLARRDDLPTRRLLKDVHRPDVSLCTNVERRLLLAFQHRPKTAVGAFVERDAIQRAHLWAVVVGSDGQLHRLALSHTTHVELLPQALERLEQAGAYSRT